MADQDNQNPIGLSPQKLKKLYKRHLQGAIVRSGASVFMWLSAMVAFLFDSIETGHLIGISISVVYLILINLPTLVILRHITSKRIYESFSIFINLLEIIGYTSVIYVLGGINALFLGTIYAALIAYVGAVSPPRSPFIIAGLCGVTFSIMVILEFFGILPHLDPFWQHHLPGTNQIIITLTVICLLFVVAFISSYTGMLLKRNKIQLREQNTELMASRIELKLATETLKQKNEELQNAIIKTRESDQMKSEFLANMSHELRTPLNHIIGFTELIVDKKCGDINETQEEYLKDMLQSSRFLLSLINDILDLSKIEAGKLEMEISDVPVKALLENSLMMIKEKAKKHGIQLSMETDGVPYFLKADERQLKQVIYNLLSNAVKFTPDGGKVSVQAKVVDAYVRPGRRTNDPKYMMIIQHPRSESEASDMQKRQGIEFAVIDNGIGVKLGDQSRIFNRFEQVDGSTQKKYQGTGLGLALCKHIVEIHGGRIWVESKGEGKGSEFRFVIPV